MFNKNNFDLLNFTSNDSGQVELEGVFFTEQFSIATDGFKLLQVSTPKESIDDYPVIPNRPKPKKNFQPFILPKDKVKKVLDMFKKKESLPILNNAVILSKTDKQVEIAKTDGESIDSIVAQIIQEKYPNCKEIIKEKTKHIEILVNPNYLKSIVDYYCKFLGDKTLKIQVPVKEKRMIKFYGKGEMEQEATALLMPIMKGKEEE